MPEASTQTDENLQPTRRPLSESSKKKYDQAIARRRIEKKKKNFRPVFHCLLSLFPALRPLARRESLHRALSSEAAQSNDNTEKAPALFNRWNHTRPAALVAAL